MFGDVELDETQTLIMEFCAEKCGAKKSSGGCECRGCRVTRMIEYVYDFSEPQPNWMKKYSYSTEYSDGGEYWDDEEKKILKKFKGYIRTIYCLEETTCDAGLKLARSHLEQDGVDQVIVTGRIEPPLIVCGRDAGA